MYIHLELSLDIFDLTNTVDTFLWRHLQFKEENKYDLMMKMLKTVKPMEVFLVEIILSAYLPGGGVYSVETQIFPQPLLQHLRSPLQSIS